MDDAASDWSAQSTLNFGGGSDPTGGKIKWVTTARDPIGNDIMVAWEDSNANYWSALWDGSSFGAVTHHNVSDGDGVSSDGVKNSPTVAASWPPEKWPTPSLTPSRTGHRAKT